MPAVGDRVQVPARKIGEPTREGVVTGVVGSLLRVEWASGDESVFAPAAGSLVVLGRARSSARPAKRTASGTKKAAGTKRAGASAKETAASKSRGAAKTAGAKKTSSSAKKAAGPGAKKTARSTKRSRSG